MVKFSCSQGASDTQILATLFDKKRELFPQILTLLKGPYAFVFYDKSLDGLWYARDIVGRRSLCSNNSSDEGQLTICSVAPSLDGWQEVTTEGIHCIDLSGGKFTHSCRRWSHSLTGKENPSPVVQTPIGTKFPYIQDMDEAIEHLRKLLFSSIQKRVCLRRKGAKVAILFSGGIDSSVIALIANEF